MTNRERISGVDTAWLRMDQPTNLMMIVGVMMFREKLDPAAVRRAVESRFLAYRRFRSRAVQEEGAAWWLPQDAVDLEWHVRTVRLRGKGTKAGLERLVSELASTALDPSRPLWQFHLVENFDGGSALVTRIHHCYADGIALVKVMLSMTHATAHGSLSVEPRDLEEPAADADLWQLFRPFTEALGGASRAGRELIEQGRQLVARPQQAVDRVQEAARKGIDLAAEVANLALMGSDSPTRFKGPLGVKKRAAWAAPLPLDEVKAVGKALGCSINDVLLSMAAGALRGYLESHGDPVDGIAIRAIVPVNLRPLSQGHALGNHFGLVFLELPIGIEHPLERLYEVRRRMGALKDSFQPAIALALLHLVGLGPRSLQQQVTQLLGQSASAVMTNVPGPQHPLYFAGRRIAELEFWVPQSGGIGMGVSILSYDGRIHFGVITDAGRVPRPGAIVERFGAEFEKLLWLTLMSPWGGDEPGAAAAAGASKATRATRNPGAAKVPRRFRNLPR